MNQELEKLIDMTIQKGSITDKEKEIILRKALVLNEAQDEVELIIENKLVNQKIIPTSTNKTNEGSFPIPIWVGWGINILAWVLFVATFNHIIEIFMGLACSFSIYIGYRHRQMGSSPYLDMARLSANNLIYTSIVDAVWMFSWGLGIWGSF